MAVDSSGAADLENTSEPRLGVKGGRGSGASGQDLADLASQLLGALPAPRVINLAAAEVKSASGTPNPRACRLSSSPQT